MPDVSIVIPCFNHGATLQETLDSVNSQTSRNYEVVVVDDGSTDEATVRFLDQLAVRNIEGLKVLRTANQGVSAARNEGIRAAQGQYVLTLDADDRIASDYLEKAYEIFESQPGILIVYGERTLFGEKTGQAPLPSYDKRRLLVENMIYPASFFRKKSWQEVGGYNEKMVYGWEDWDFWIALSSLGGKVVKIPEEMFFYRVASTSRDHSLKFFRKLHMFALMLRRNRKQYLRNLPYVCLQLCKIHIFRMRAS